MSHEGAVASICSRLHESIISGDVANGLEAWQSFKPLLIEVLASIATSTIDTIRLLRDALEGACLLHGQQGDVIEFEKAYQLLEPLYYDFPQIPSSAMKGTVLALALLRLLMSGRIGDMHVKFQRLTEEERKSVEVSFVIELERSLMAGSYEKCAMAIPQPPNPCLKFFCEDLKASLRDRVASCLQKSHTKISVARAKQLLMIDSNDEFHLFLEERNKDQAVEADMVGESIGDELEPHGRLVNWQLENGFLVFKPVEQGKKHIPVAEMMNYVIGYATELERIV